MSNHDYYQSSGYYGQHQQQQPGYTPPPEPSPWQQAPPAANPNNTNFFAQQPQQQSSQQQSSQQYSNQYSSTNANHYSNMSQGASPFWNPASAAMAAATMANTGMSSDTMIDIASGMGKNFIQSNAARMIPGLEMTMIALRSYFHVDNRYVQRKMAKCLFPFMSKDWKRLQKDTGGGPHGMMPQYELPTLDENAPDLYLPVMALITYVLLCALCYGNAGQFNPEVLPDVTTRCILTQIMEVVLIRFGFYAMQVPTPILDLFCFTGYKYVGLSLNMLVGLLCSHFGVGAKAFYLTLLWTASAAAYSMLKIMANNIPTQTSSAGPKREVMVLAFAGSQLLTMWFVSQTKFL